MSSNENWVLGATLGLLGSIAINTGNNIQSLGLRSLHEKVASETSTPKPRKQSLTFLSPTKIHTATFDSNDSSQFAVVHVGKKSPLTSIIWVIGTTIFVSGSLLNFASYAFAAQSMLASLESIQFVTNLLFGKFMLGARVTRAMLAGTCLTVTGTVVAVQFSSKDTLDLDTREMKRLYFNPAYLCYLAVMGGLLVGLRILYQNLDNLKKAGKPIKHSDVIMAIVYSIWSALFGTQSVVQAKVLAELISVHSMGNENIFKSWFTYVTILIWIVTCTVWLKRLNDALDMFDPLFIIPLLQCSFIFFAIVSGGIFFKEFNSFDATQWIGFWFGIIVMFSGLVLLTPKPTSTNDKDEDLQRELVNFILTTGGVGGSPNGNQGIQRSIVSPNLTPRNSTVDAAGENAVNLIVEDFANSGKRTPRFSKENLYNTARDAVREVVKDSALIFQADPSKKILSDAMVSAAANEDDRRRRRKALESLLALLKDNPISSLGYSEEVIDLIRDLNFDVIVSPVSSDVPVGRHLSVSKESLQDRILIELEENKSPRDEGQLIRNLTKVFNKELPDG